jgi:hypothetical protein
LSPAELAELSKQLQALIDQARALQDDIAQHSAQHRRANRLDRTGEPRPPAKTKTKTTERKRG